ncbi:SRPBCC domain-containing protein [Alteromonas ponticola]|uniref:SRPBCC domain-containing protein n=1 Tax=Alteromonas aquimaris TaxID=2998417 RepID=A0ABT3PAV1_9ALTE|nr:SRPBCC domain-containing protein [Alteromonas aquimaris]MCW8109897.1 SRPBCC domain-containing protein [Alteromonas aquimaris]
MMNLVARAQSIVRSSPDKVFEAFVNPERMKKFWFHRTDSGLKMGESVTWFIGDDDDAFGFTVQVLELKKDSLIHIKWGNEDTWTEVRWILEETNTGDTKLTIEETGFTGSNDDIIVRALDSTGGFNQVIVAAKALLEHNTVINIVTDHA